ncbi:MAG: response regulator transcription factor [Spirulina sp. SIO3F2]|nr:response regulator transcription factor [Spirulina sp. SIO3F2]
MAPVQVLIIEGNQNLRSLLGWHLQQVGHQIQQAATLQQAWNHLLRGQPNLVVMDPDLKDGNGLELCQWLYNQRQSLILVISAKDTAQDVVSTLRLGADDYLRKPFGMQEFLARAEALLRRCRSSTIPLSLQYGTLAIDLVQRRVNYEGRYIDLTPQEFSLLYVLVQSEGSPLSRSELLHRAWPDAIDNPRTIDTHVLSLRKKIAPGREQPSLIQTVRNVGYRFNLEMLNQGESEAEAAPAPASTPAVSLS